ncbi:MAG: tetratricopeptide repeat protein, partial [Caldilineaceae bacterium]|nr:tetratricopeptide repeat protein [Caldilineaceae bacterium]
MDENQALASLRTVLAFLYESEYDARRVAEDAGLNVQQIPFSGKAINLWNAILREAEKEGKTAILMGVTFREFKENQKLSTAWYDYLKAAGESAVETNQPMPAAMSEQPLSPQRPSPQRSSGQRHWGRIITIAVVLIIAVVAIWRVVELIGNSTLPAAFPPSTRQSVATATPHKAQVGAVRIATVTPRPKATATPTASARSYFDRGRKLMDEGKYQSAIAQFDLALEHGLKSAELYYNRGLACYGLQDLEQQCGYTKAIAEYDKAIALEPNNADYYAARAWSYRHLEDPQSIEQAIADWQRAAELDPTNSTYPREIGWRLKEMGNIEGALAQLNRAIELDGDYWAYIGRGQIYNEHFHDPEQALSDFSRAIEQEPDDANPYAHRAWFFMAQRQWEKALVDLDQAIALAPDWFGLYWDRGNVHKALENVEATRTDYQAFLNLLAEKNEPDWASQRDEARDWLQLTANLTEKNTLKVRI